LEKWNGRNNGNRENDGENENDEKNEGTKGKKNFRKGLRKEEIEVREERR
jgi:hypothetical protein